MMLQGDIGVDIIRVKEHYEGYVNGRFIVSGDTYNEVRKYLLEMGYIQ